MGIQENLEKLNFTKLEAQIYLALLGQEPMSAYQLAKRIEIARSSIYNALEHMLEKGMVEMVPSDTALYAAQSPEVILGKLHFEMTEAIRESEKQLKEYQRARRKEIHFVFKGFETFVFRTRALLKEARSQIYLNADFNLSCFGEEFRTLRDRHVRIVAFSFYDLDFGCEVELYSHHRKLDSSHMPSRFMMVVDNRISLLADRGAGTGAWSGTVSNNELLIKVLSEHIHNDIYLLKLKGRYGREIYDDGLKLDTLFEIKQRGAIRNESDDIGSGQY